MARPLNNVVWLDKTCSVCKLEKPHTEFYKVKNRPGLKSECKECTPILQMKYKANPNSVRVIGSRPVPLEKSCTKCGEVKSYTEFYKGKGRITSQCKVCTDVRLKSYIQKNPNVRSKFKTREYTMGANYQKFYGVSLEQVKKMLEMQNGRCGNNACAAEITLGKKGQSGTTRGVAFLDHCHTTGKVRGLLCMPCNTTLGHLERKSRVAGLEEYMRQNGQELFN